MYYFSPNFLVKCRKTGQIWLFNCPEGCQHLLVKKKIKINQITNIIITSLHINNIGGIIGLLSSLSLSSRLHHIKIYGPQGILHYFQLLRRYSQTTFKYNLEIHIIKHGLIYISKCHYFYIYPVTRELTHLAYTIVENEKIGRFKSIKANLYHIQAGPLYGRLKLQNRLLNPDGLILQGKCFTNPYSLGIKVIYPTYHYVSRYSLEYSFLANIILWDTAIKF